MMNKDLTFFFCRTHWTGKLFIVTFSSLQSFNFKHLQSISYFSQWTVARDVLLTFRVLEYRQSWIDSNVCKFLYLKWRIFLYATVGGWPLTMENCCDIGKWFNFPIIKFQLIQTYLNGYEPYVRIIKNNFFYSAGETDFVDQIKELLLRLLMIFDRIHRTYYTIIPYKEYIKQYAATQKNKIIKCDTVQ